MSGKSSNKVVNSSGQRGTTYILNTLPSVTVMICCRLIVVLSHMRLDTKAKAPDVKYDRLKTKDEEVKIPAGNNEKPSPPIGLLSL